MIDILIEKYTKGVDKKKAAWMSSYEKFLSKRDDHKAGRVDWDTATYLYNKGESAEEAAKSVKEPYKP